MNLAYSPDQYVAFWSGIGAIAAVAAGGVAIFTLLALKRDSRDRTRPVITADIVPIVLSPGMTQLVIRNDGPSVALDVSVTLEPALEDSEDAGLMGPYIARRYRDPIRTFAPGRELRNVYANVRDQSDPLPVDLTVTIRYRDSQHRRYEDRYQLSVRYALNQTQSNPSNEDAVGRQRRFLAALEAIARGVNR